MSGCECGQRAQHRRVVLTGGPGAGKTAVLELVRHALAPHVDVLPEAASILFVGGFRRCVTDVGQQATQRGIFHVQREVEAIADAEGKAALEVCDRGSVDGFAYWPGDAAGFWAALGTTQAAELARYRAVIHLRTPSAGNGYNHDNPVRIESADEAARIDARIELAWQGHPRRFVVQSTADFLTKANQAIALLRAELPERCLAALQAAHPTKG